MDHRRDSRAHEERDWKSASSPPPEPGVPRFSSIVSRILRG